MNNHASQSDGPADAAHSGRRRRRRIAIAAGVAAVALLGAFAASQAGHRMLAQTPLTMSLLGPSIAAAAPFDDGDWRGGLYDDIIGAVVEARADRAVRHLAIEVDASPEQAEKLRAIVRDAVKDLLPFRDKIIAMRVTARDLLTRETVDRAAIEKFRTDALAIHDAASRRAFQAVADAAEVLTPDQRRRIADLAANLAARHRPWGHGPWGHWGGFRN